MLSKIKEEKNMQINWRNDHRFISVTKKWAEIFVIYHLRKDF